MIELDPSIAANAKIAVGAAAGGIVRSFLRPARSLTHTVLLLFSCVTCGFYGTQPLIDWFSLPVDYAGAVGAALGFLGLSIAEGLLRAFDRFDFRQFLLNFFGKGA